MKKINLKKLGIILIILGIISIIIGLEVDIIDIIGFCIGIVFISIGIIAIVNNNKKIKKNNNKNNINQTTSNNVSNLIKEVYFKVAGVTFDDRQEIIKKIVNYDLNNNYFSKKYQNMTNKEIIENNEIIYEANNIKINSLRLEPTLFEKKDAIEIYIKDYDNKEYLIGYVPEQKIQETLDFLEFYQNNPNYKLVADSYFTGGKYKEVEYDADSEKDIVVIKEDNYGINVNLKLYEK